jgi:hypothetical protein
MTGMISNIDMMMIASILHLTSHLLYTLFPHKAIGHLARSRRHFGSLGARRVCQGLCSGEGVISSTLYRIIH